MLVWYCCFCLIWLSISLHVPFTCVYVNVCILLWIGICVLVLLSCFGISLICWGSIHFSEYIVWERPSEQTALNLVCERVLVVHNDALHTCCLCIFDTNSKAIFQFIQWNFVLVYWFLFYFNVFICRAYLAELCLFYLISSSRWLFEFGNVPFPLFRYMSFCFCLFVLFFVKLNFIEVKWQRWQKYIQTARAQCTITTVFVNHWDTILYIQCALTKHKSTNNYLLYENVRYFFSYFHVRLI